MADTNMHEGECFGAGANKLDSPDGTRRWAIWEVPGNFRCSIIDTCLSQSDILRLAWRFDLQIDPGTADYDIHAHFVREAWQYDKTLRLVQNELERRFSGMVRRVRRLSGEPELAALWQGRMRWGKFLAPSGL